MNYLSVMFPTERHWQSLNKTPPSPKAVILGYAMLISLVPAVCGYIGATSVGWSVGSGPTVYMTQSSAFFIALGTYVSAVASIFLLSAAMDWMAPTYGAEQNLGRSAGLIATVLTPVYLVGIAGLYPVVWLISCLFLAALAYSAYLFYSGTAKVFGIEVERAFVYASAVLAFGLVLFAGVLVVSVTAWSFGFEPVFTSGL